MRRHRLPALSFFCSLVVAGSVILESRPTAGKQPAAPPRPNILFIMADDLGTECLACYGGLDARTPHLDALAQAGARFTQAHAQPLCTPTRVQLMTGKYNFRNYEQFGYLSPEETTFADLLRDAGYRTGIFGKWQLSGQGTRFPDRNDPARWGFDNHCLWQLNFRAGHGEKGSRYWQPKLERQGTLLPVHPDDFGPDLVSAALAEFVAEESDRPFLAYYPMILTHDPFDPAPGTPRSGGANPRNFPGMVQHMDTIVGRLLARLDELHLAQNTLVIFTGDNGTSGAIQTRTRDGIVQGGKGRTIRTGTHVPLLVRWPGKIPPGTVTDRLVDFTDMLPSLLAASNTPLPDGFVADGIPFLTADGLATTPRDAVYSWYHPRQSAGANRQAAVFAHEGRFKLYADGRLFDMQQTPNETPGDVLAAPLSTEAAAAQQKLQAVLDRYAAEGGVLPGGRVREVRP